MARKRSFAVIGLGRFGAATAETLSALGQEVIGIDSSAERVRQLSDIVSLAVELDATDEKALRDVGVPDVDVAVISIGANIEASLLIVMMVREMGVPTIIAKATTALHGRTLERLGVSRVVFPEREMAHRVAHSLVVPNVLDYIELSTEYSIVEVPVPASFVGRSLRDLELRSKYGLTLIAIKRRTAAGSEQTNVAPAGDDVLMAGDVLALVGSHARFAELESLLQPRGH